MMHYSNLRAEVFFCHGFIIYNDKDADDFMPERIFCSHGRMHLSRKICLILNNASI